MADIVPELPPYHMCDHVSTEELKAQREMAINLINACDKAIMMQPDEAQKAGLDDEAASIAKVVVWIDGLIDYRKNRIK